MLVQAVKKMFRRRYGDALQIKRQRNIAQLGRTIHHHVTFVYLAFNKEKSYVNSYSSKKNNHFCTWLNRKGHRSKKWKPMIAVALGLFHAQESVKLQPSTEEVT